MDTEVDLTTVDRDVLIERLQRRIAELEGQAKQQGPRKQRRHGFARPRMTPTHRVEHVMENCPD